MGSTTESAGAAAPAGAGATIRRKPLCRFCGAGLEVTFADLGVSPLANSYLTAEQLGEPETFYPLHARVCGECFLVQVEEVATPEEIFSEYAYFSSVSESWVAHAGRFAEEAVARFDLDASSLVVEIASNDGYLLQHFDRRDIPVLGVEPAANVAAAAADRGIRTLNRFFDTELAESLVADGVRADLLVGNNVLAHVPDVDDFVAGLATLLAPDGVLAMEFPHLQRLVEGSQFDTIYHEHFSYFSLLSVRRVMAARGLEIFDIDELDTHGGSLRIFVQHHGEGRREVASTVDALARRERELGYEDLDLYRSFAERVRRTKRRFLSYLIEASDEGRRVVGYGAPAKGNTLLNSCGVGPDLLEYTVDLSPHKQGLFLPGSRIPIHAPERIAVDEPDDVLVLPWNLAEEITRQMAQVREWGGRFVVAIPKVTIL